MTYFNDFIALGLISLLAAISPGPDFVIVTQNSLAHGKKAGIYTALGVALGCLVHISYCIIGIAVLVAESIIAFNIIKYLGAVYLIYIGLKGIFAKAPNMQSDNTSTAAKGTSLLLSPLQAIYKGLLVNVLNPKATLFFLSIFTQMIDPTMPKIIQSLLGIEFSLIAFFWFSFLSFLLTYPILKNTLRTFQHYVDKALGAILVAFGLKIATFTPQV